MSPTPPIKCETKVEFVSITIDGTEVIALNGEMLIDAAKKADIEIPYFCYEPKLGAPVGACRMCLVEVEGIPKLQTACSTPVKDGMVVNTVSKQVKEVQEAVAEFMLVNHPLDCPVCDKGGECPLQDVTMGWGPERSRSIEPKRHFVKPVKLSPLLAIDRERCILCYRCVRFSQEISGDDQLVFLNRGSDTFVGTFDGRDYIAPFSGNITELCPVGALTSTEYRFKARPWDIEYASSICTLCPAQCNVKLTVRDEKIERVLARDDEGNPGVDNGWLCDKGRYAYRINESEKRLTQPMVRRDGALQPASWDEALDTAARGLKRAAPNVASIVGGETTNEEGFLIQAIMRDALESPNIDSRSNGLLDPMQAQLLNRPELQASVQDIDDAELILVLDADPANEMPILDLRIRKAVHLNSAKLVIATGAPTTLDSEGVSVRYQPQMAEAFLMGLTKALLEQDEIKGPEGVNKTAAFGRLKTKLGSHTVESLAERSGAEMQDLRNLASLMVESEKTVVIWGERAGYGRYGDNALKGISNIAMLIGLDGQNAGGLLEVTAGTNSRGLRDVGCLPNLGPGLIQVPATGLSASEIPSALQDGKIGAVYLLHSDPLRDLPDSAGWRDGLQDPTFVVAQTQYLSEELAALVNVVFPSEVYAEKQGTVTHPDGRIQRLKSAIPRAGNVRMEWQVLADLGSRLGLNDPPRSASAIYESIQESVPYYSGVELAETSRHGLRWQDCYSTAKAPEAEVILSVPDDPAALVPLADSRLRLGTRSSLWASFEVEHSVALGHLLQSQLALLSVSDAEKLGVSHGETVLVASNGNSVEAVTELTSAIAEGSVFLYDGLVENRASVLTDGEPKLVEVRRKES